MVIRYKISRNELDRLILYKNFMSTSIRNKKIQSRHMDSDSPSCYSTKKDVIAWEKRDELCRKASTP